MKRAMIFAMIFVAGVGVAFAVQAPIYTDSGGHPQGAQGVFLLDPDNGSSIKNATYTDASISSATGASQTVVAASTSRRYVLISNPGATTWWINPSGATASANCAGCFEVPPGVTWTPRVPPVNAVTGIGTAASKLTVVGG